MADTNKIKYGIKNVYYSVATIATDGTATYGTPKKLPGAVSLSLDAQGDANNFHADDIVYYTSIANNGYEGDLELAYVPESFLKDVLGQTADDNGALYEYVDAPVTHFALLFEFNGDAHAKRHAVYNCVATRPTLGSQTKEDSIEPQTETLSITATSVYVTALTKDVVKASVTPTESTQYNGWFSAVYQPVHT